mmetsp:Transcript_52102/g.135665  ORF Transcript_52102/g.135665 Transcript_52102/m.135665 type:complete len:349 (-) Transcript_52102:351-1397(-)
MVFAGLSRPVRSNSGRFCGLSRPPASGCTSPGTASTPSSPPAAAWAWASWMAPTEAFGSLCLPQHSSKYAKPWAPPPPQNFSKSSSNAITSSLLLVLRRKSPPRGSMSASGSAAAPAPAPPAGNDIGCEPVGGIGSSIGPGMLISLAHASSAAGRSASSAPAGSASSSTMSGACATVAAFWAPVTAEPRSASRASGRRTAGSAPKSTCRNPSMSGQRLASAIFERAPSGSPRPSAPTGTGPRPENMSLAAAGALLIGTSPLNTSDRSSATGRWLRSRPFAPPASKAAAMRRNIGSLCSSASKCCWMMVASFLSSVFTPQMRRRFFPGPSAPSATSSSSMPALRPPSTR